VFIVTGGAGHAIPGPGGWAGPVKGSAGRREKAPAGVEPDECPHGLGNAQPSTRPPGRGGQNGQGVAQQVAGARKLVERREHLVPIESSRGPLLMAQTSRTQR